MKTKQFLNGAMDLAGKSYQLKYNIRAIVLFEKLATQEATITFDDFVDAISQQQMKQAIVWTREQMENEAEAV